MIIDERTFALKDGRQALLRSARPEDAQASIDYLHCIAGETDYVSRYPEEFDGLTLERETAWIERTIKSENEAMIVCIVGGAYAGNCSISWKNSIKTRHRARIGIAMYKAYWGLGIGTQMMRTMIDIAEAQPDLLQIELEFIEGNARARALYEKMGFRITGVHPDAFRLKDGTLLNEYTMIRPMGRRA